MKRFFLLLIAWILAALVVFVTLGPVADRPQLGHPQLERFAAFLALGVCWGRVYPARPGRLLLGLTLAAIALELAQALVPGRDPGLPDALAKIGGAAAGVGIAIGLRRLGHRDA